VEHSFFHRYPLDYYLALINYIAMARHAELGELEELTLLAVMRLDPDAYGASVRRELEETAGRSVSIATAYVTLLRLEKKGFLASWGADPEPVRGGKAKRCYRITASGAKAVRSARDAVARMWEGLEGHRNLR
jgi:DNA-binding PadR family transcriptional regulator